jgi:hypothetical protein
LRTLVFLLEELSARDLLQGFLPRILPADLLVRYLVFEGKQDLERQLVHKLRSWLAPESIFVVLRDQDAADCTSVKERLSNLVKQTGRQDVLVRIACRELESWVIGDWEAVAQAFDKPQLRAQAQKAVYRHPDRLSKPIGELRKFIPEYQKRDGARRLGPLLSPERSQSQSFRSFCSGLERLLSTLRNK